MITIADGYKILFQNLGLLFQSIFLTNIRGIQIDKLNYECDVRSQRLVGVSGGRDLLDKQSNVHSLPECATSPIGWDQKWHMALNS